jgi:hypothetical protein
MEAGGIRSRLPAEVHDPRLVEGVDGNDGHIVESVTSIRVMSKASVAEVLRHAGYSPEAVREMLELLADPVDFDRDAEILARYRVDRNYLTDRMGGSP